MEGTASPATHRYYTRSSQSPPSHVGDQPAATTSINVLYQMRADIVVKETVYGRDHSGKRLQPQVFEGASWEAIKERIFEFAKPNIMSLASHISDPREWSVSPEPPTIEDFDIFITIKMHRNHFKPNSTTQAHQYLADHVGKAFTIAVFKWGNKINSAADLMEFQHQCIAPQAQDRAGAAAEALHQQTVASLKTKWGNTYTAYESTWRMWAAHILKRPSFEHEALLAHPPPVQMIHLFESVANGAQALNDSLQQSLTLARDVVDSCLDDIEVVLTEAEDIFVRLKAFRDMLKVKKRVIHSFNRSIEPQNVHDSINNVLSNIPNLEDVDHDERSALV